MSHVLKVITKETAGESFI